MNRTNVLLAVPIISENSSRLRHRYHPPNIGLACIASYLIERGIHVKIFDGYITPSYDALKNIIESFRPGIVGISAFTCEIKSASRAAGFIKSLGEEIITVIGGHHATVIPADTLEEFAGFDLAVAGEGENTFYEIIKASQEGEDFTKSSGVACRDNGEIIVAEASPVSADLNDMPRPAWDLFDLDKYRLYRLISQLIQFVLLLIVSPTQSFLNQV